MSTSPQLKFYASREFLPPGIPHVPLLFPFWGLPKGEESAHVFAQFITNGPSYLRTVEPRLADFFVLPFDWRYTTRAFAPTEAAAEAAQHAAKCFSGRAAESGKRLVVFFVSDSEEEVPLPNSLVFRTSLRRGLRHNEFAMPVFFEDIARRKLGSSLPLRPKLQRPSVGFCGFAGYRLIPEVDPWRKMRCWIRWAYKGFPRPTVRERAIGQLRQHSTVVTDFVLRENAKGRGELGGDARDAFYRNLVSTDYTVCARGRGNWSIRFYETLAFARIPLFVDTECVLPYDFEVNYKDLAVWVDADNIESIADQLVEFHDQLDERTFAELQRTCRLVWEQRLTPEGFFSHFDRHFQLA